MFGGGPEGSHAGGDLKHKVADFEQFFSPNVGVELSDNEYVVDGGALVPGGHEFFNGYVSSSWGRGTEHPGLRSRSWDP